MVAAFLAIIVTGQLAGASASGYHIVDSFKLAGGVRWDYVTFDDAQNRLFVTREHSVDAIDAATGRVLGTIPDLGRAHGVALDPTRHRGFITDEGGHNVVIFDTDTLQVTTKVSVGEGPDAIVFDDVSGTAFAIDHDSRDVTPIAAAADHALPPIPLPDEPEFATTDGSGHVFINLTNKAEVAVIDTVARTLKQTWPLGPACVSATGLAIDRPRQRLIATCRNGVMQILSSVDGHGIASVPIGKFSDAAAFDPGTQTAFSSNQDGTLSVVTTDGSGTYALRDTVSTPKGTRTMAVDAKTHRLYLPGGILDHIEPPAGERPYPLTVMKEGSFNVLVLAP